MPVNRRRNMGLAVYKKLYKALAKKHDPLFSTGISNIKLTKRGSVMLKPLMVFDSDAHILLGQHNPGHGYTQGWCLAPKFTDTITLTRQPNPNCGCNPWLVYGFCNYVCRRVSWLGNHIESAIEAMSDTN